jgi:hypothetical protein
VFDLVHRQNMHSSAENESTGLDCGNRSSRMYWRKTFPSNAVVSNEAFLQNDAIRYSLNSPKNCNTIKSNVTWQLQSGVSSVK